MKPKITFFVQAYNTGPYIGECIASILQQAGDHDFSILVIDDASKDNTEAEVRKFTDSRITYRKHAKNTGAIATASEGLSEAGGDLVMRVDSDDRLRPEFLNRVVPIFEKYPNVGLVYGDIAMIDPQGTVTVPGNLVRRHGRAPMGNELIPLLEENFIPAPTTIARKVAWQSVLPIPSDYRFCDWYLTLGMAEKWDFYFVDEVLADYRIHSSNMHRAMIQDGTGEITSFKILDQVFSGAERASEKQQIKSRIYSRSYLEYGDKYFGIFMNADARRCYMKAIAYDRGLLLRPDIMRRLGATVLGRKPYEAAKRLFKRNQ